MCLYYICKKKKDFYKFRPKNKKEENNMSIVKHRTSALKRKSFQKDSIA